MDWLTLSWMSSTEGHEVVLPRKRGRMEREKKGTKWAVASTVQYVL